MNAFPDCIAQSILVNGEYFASDVVLAPQGGTSVYEIIRIIEGVPLFLDDHITRFLESFRILNLTFPLSSEAISEMVIGYIVEVGIVNGNLKFQFTTSKVGGVFLAYATAFNYPAMDSYKSGVSVGLLYAERQHPNAKDLQPLRNVANAYVSENHLYEALLVNKQGNITEGSRSNVFFKQKHTFVTAPADEVLKGITRKYVIQAIQNCGYTLEIRPFSVAELEDTEAAFISGTSPKVLPISNVGDIKLNPRSQQIDDVRMEYDKIIKDYIFTAKSNKQWPKERK